MSADLEAARSAFLQEWAKSCRNGVVPEDDVVLEADGMANAMRQIALLVIREDPPFVRFGPRLRRLIGGAAP